MFADLISDVLTSVCWGVVLGPIVLFVFVLLKLVLNVPLCDPVFDELLELVLLGDAAVGTRCPYCKKEKEDDKGKWMLLIIVISSINAHTRILGKMIRERISLSSTMPLYISHR